MSVPQAILFDLDGLMVDSEPLAEKAWNNVLESHGHSLSAQVLQQVLGMRVIDSAARLCRIYELPISPEEAAAARDEAFFELARHELPAREGLHSLLEDLKRRDIPLAVATSGHQQYANLALSTLRIAPYFQAVATGDEVEHGKPAPDVFLLAAKRLGVEPHLCLVLEDSLLGVTAARAAGMTCVAVPSPRISVSEFSVANWVFPSLIAVHQALDEILAGPELPV